jgi:hypothetical protein
MLIWNSKLSGKNVAHNVPFLNTLILAQRWLIKYQNMLLHYSSSSAALQPRVGCGLLHQLIPLLSISSQLLPILHLLLSYKYLNKYSCVNCNTAQYVYLFIYLLHMSSRTTRPSTLFMLFACSSDTFTPVTIQST